MTIEVYIMGNSVGRVTAESSPSSKHPAIIWNNEALRAVKNINKHDSCMGSIIELFKGGYSYATFGEGIGELKVI